MAPHATAPFSPAELSYLHSSLRLSPPIRPDGRTPTQFRPLSAETDLLPGTNGSARVGFADGSEAIVGIKAEVARTKDDPVIVSAAVEGGDGEQDDGVAMEGQNDWVSLSIEIPGYRDDDGLPIFLAEMMREGLLAGDDGVESLKSRLVINRFWHWKIYIDVLLLSPPQAYPLPLLSLTTHLALLSTRLPMLKSQGNEDPAFDDDWASSIYLYRRTKSPLFHRDIVTHRPPVTLLVIAVGENVIFDPSREEIAVAEALLAVTIGDGENHDQQTHATVNPTRNLRLLAMRTIDPPSRLTQPGVPNEINTATGGVTKGALDQMETRDADVSGVWKPPRGGIKRGIISKMVRMVLKPGGVGEEVLSGLESVEVG